MYLCTDEYGKPLMAFTDEDVAEQSWKITYREIGNIIFRKEDEDRLPHEKQGSPESKRDTLVFLETRSHKYLVGKIVWINHSNIPDHL